MNKQLSHDSLMHVLPMPLDEDPSMHVLGDATARELSVLGEKTDLPRLFPRIDELQESLLDILARDFKVDWYNYDADLETKRMVIRDSFYIHRHLGTPAAVQRAINDIFGTGYLEEWFEYGGNPYHFMVYTSNTSIMRENRNRFYRLLAIVKSVRSVLDGIVYYGESEPAETTIGTAVVAVCSTAVSALAMRDAGTESEGFIETEMSTAAVAVQISIQSALAMRDAGVAASGQASSAIRTSAIGVSGSIGAALAMRDAGMAASGTADTTTMTKVVGVSGQIETGTAKPV